MHHSIGQIITIITVQITGSRETSQTIKTKKPPNKQKGKKKQENKNKK